MDQKQQTQDKPQTTGSQYDRDTQGQPAYRYGQADRSPSERDQMGNPGQPDYKGTSGQADPKPRKPFQDADEMEKETTGEGQ